MKSRLEVIYWRWNVSFVSVMVNGSPSCRGAVSAIESSEL